MRKPIVARAIRLAIGGLLLVLGMLFALQGFGLVDWPASSPMIGEKRWALYGVIAAASGAILLWLESGD